MGARVVQHFLHLFEDVRGRRLVRVSHTKIDDVITFGAGGLLECVHLGKDIRRQAADAVKVIIHRILSQSLVSETSSRDKIS